VDPFKGGSSLRVLEGKTVILGVLSLDAANVESESVVAARIRLALKHVPPARLILAPDCGLKYLSRATAFAKLKAMTAAARVVRSELA
jgi:5-methyltetrahydropteroyltriglutamate--homocysteine methyltransferase